MEKEKNRELTLEDIESLRLYLAKHYSHQIIESEMAANRKLARGQRWREGIGCWVRRVLRRRGR